MQTVWTFLVHFWLLWGLRTPPDPLAYGPESDWSARHFFHCKCL